MPLAKNSEEPCRLLRLLGARIAKFSFWTLFAEFHLFGDSALNNTKFTIRVQNEKTAKFQLFAFWRSERTDTQRTGFGSGQESCVSLHPGRELDNFNLFLIQSGHRQTVDGKKSSPPPRALV